MKYTFAVSDYDHTLANESSQVSARNQSAIQEFQKAGGRFMLCTGRMFAAARVVAKKVGLKGDIIAYNGALIGNIESGEVSYQTLLNKEVALKLIHDLEKEPDFSVRIYVGDTMYTEKEDSKVRAYADIYNASYCVTGEPLYDYFSKNSEDIVLIRAIASEAKVLELYKKYRAQGSADYNVVVSMANFLEFISPNADKGITFQYYCEKNGINPQKVVTFGDNYNDINMIKYVGLGVAVSNGVDELRENADYICPTNEDDGVGKTLEKIIKGEI